MRWKSIAGEVIQKLHSAGVLKREDHSEIQKLLNFGDPIGSFHLTLRASVKAEITVGWNKIWRGSTLYGWFGSHVTVQPLRAVAFEIETDDQVYKAATRILSSDTVSQTPMENDPVSCRTLRMLAEFDVWRNPVSNHDNRLQLLRRVNLDRRELPFAERKYWSGNTGFVQLSDEGRFQVSRDLVWTRAIEAGIEDYGNIAETVRTFLSEISENTTHVTVKDSDRDDGVNAVIKRLELYGYGRLRFDRLEFAVPAGGFPEMALRLYDQ